MCLFVFILTSAVFFSVPLYHKFCAGTKMTTVICVVLCLLTGVMEVYSQSFPYISFMGTRLSNHSYVDLTLVGIDVHGSVQCHTDLTSCCSNTDGHHRGDWFFPNGNRLPFSSTEMTQRRLTQRVDLRSTGNGLLSGIYHCVIETNVINEDNAKETVYVGLYSNGGQ